MADAKPLKIDPKELPPAVAATLATPLAANAEFASKLRAEFSNVKSMKIDPSSLPTRVSDEEIPTEMYHVGCIPGSPFTVMYVGNQDFPMISSIRLPGSDESRSPQSVERMGTEKPMTEAQVRHILKAATLDAWRPHRGPNKDGKDRSSRWEFVPLGNDTDGKPRKNGAYFAPGDKLAAHFIYVRKLAKGEQIPFGVKDQQGNYMPTPAPLLVDETRKSAVA